LVLLSADGVVERNVPELLWMLYAKSGCHHKAATVLFEAATAAEPNQALGERIYCLSRALLSLRSTSTPGYNQSTGIFSKDLEDLLDVAKIQLKVFFTWSMAPILR
jgi:Non-repetitive/WGA-negative nucleoporin C-terminal